jgi:hypothetical protein
MQVLAEGQSIRHVQYGMGVVTQSNSERTTIDFDEFGMKKFVTSIWSAEMVGEAPAAGTRLKRRRKSVKTATKAASKIVAKPATKVMGKAAGK